MISYRVSEFVRACVHNAIKIEANYVFEITQPKIFYMLMFRATCFSLFLGHRHVVSRLHKGKFQVEISPLHVDKEIL